MRLKNIRLFGFKSFADRTEIDVDGNLVAVVGPNGCGKSNLVDAILWALGEASPKNLRAAASTDVIFNGSARRKPLGYAEVILTFDNEEGALPVATTEVTVGRRVDRSGESQYTINGYSCRQRDVYELFADTGLGRTGYAIVSQSDIDQALDASPETRRIWLDEAAGVQRYRTRKKEALSRLESAVNHLQRVNDVISEIELQREPLRQEADAARRYKQLLGSLREIESGLLILEAAKLQEQISALESSISANRAEADRLRASAEESDRIASGLSDQLRSLDLEIDRLTSRLQDAVSAHERAIAKRALAEQRLAGLAELETNRDQEEANARVRVERAQKGYQTAKEELAEAEQAVDLLLGVVSGSANEARAFAQRLDEAESALAAARRSEIERIHEEARLIQAQQRHEALRRELSDTLASLPPLESGLAEAHARLEAIRAEAQNAREKISFIRQERTTTLQELHVTEERRRRLLAEVAAFEGRIEGIRATLESFEGLPAGSKAVLEAVRSGKLSGSFRPLASAIHVPSELARAIEAALGAAAGDLLVPHSDRAKEAIRYLKDEGLGRATFLPADLVNLRERPHGIADVAKQPGVLGIAADLVSYDPNDRAAVEMHLGGVLIVEDLDVATRLAKAGNFRKMATLEGDVLYAGGAVTGGRLAKQTAGPIRLAAELESAQKKHHLLGEQILVLTEQSEALAKTLDNLGEEEAGLAKALHEHDVKATEALQSLTALREEKAATERSIGRLKTELAEMESLMTTIAVPQTAAPVEQLEKERNELLAIATGKSKDAEQARSALDDAQQRLATARERVISTEVELADARAALERRATHITNIEQEKRNQEKRLAEAEQDLGEAAKSRAEAQEQLAKARETKAELQTEIARRQEEAKAHRELARNREDLAYKDDVQRARQETRCAGVLARLLEEYSTTEEEARRQAPLIQIPVDAQKVASELRREIKSLGDVNVGAIEAYERLTERYETLTTQREDILASKAELDKSVAELDRLTRGAFQETFDKVNAALDEMFKRLFGGGSASLILSDPGKLLETGVEMEVVVPGKKKQRLELLSGGERALAACAFLFALFKVKPSPMCVLDELDAPLDGQNVERYVSLLREFSETSQFIVITHNPTTIEGAPIWFGVTMQEPGVSTVVPYRSRRPELVSGDGDPLIEARVL